MPLDLASVTRQTFLRAKSDYGGDTWLTKVVKLLEDVVGTDLRAGRPSGGAGGGRDRRLRRQACREGAPCGTPSPSLFRYALQNAMKSCSGFGAESPVVSKSVAESCTT